MVGPPFDENAPETRKFEVADENSGGGVYSCVLMFMHSSIYSYDHRRSDPYKAGTEHVAFSPPRQALLTQIWRGVGCPSCYLSVVFFLFFSARPTCTERGATFVYSGACEPLFRHRTQNVYLVRSVYNLKPLGRRFYVSSLSAPFFPRRTQRVCIIRVRLLNGGSCCLCGV